VTASKRRGELEFRKALYERIVEIDPDYREVLAGLAQIYTELGEYARGFEVDLRLARLSPRDPWLYYNLACDCSLLGRIDDALTLLRSAVLLGYSDRDRMDRDPDLENLRKDRRYRDVRREMAARE